MPCGMVESMDAEGGSLQMKDMKIVSTVIFLALLDTTSLTLTLASPHASADRNNVTLLHDPLADGPGA